MTQKLHSSVKVCVTLRRSFKYPPNLSFCERGHRHRLASPCVPNVTRILRGQRQVIKQLVVKLTSAVAFLYLSHPRTKANLTIKEGTCR